MSTFLALRDKEDNVHVQELGSYKKKVTTWVGMYIQGSNKELSRFKFFLNVSEIKNEFWENCSLYLERLPRMKNDVTRVFVRLCLLSFWMFCKNSKKLQRKYVYGHVINYARPEDKR